MLLDDVCMEMNEIRGSLGSLLSQVRDLRAAHTEANADRADMANKLIEYERAAVCLDSAADHPTREVQDADEPSKPSLSEYNALDELCRDLQRALDTRSSELETVVEKMRGCESVNAALTRECELLKHRVEKYTRMTTDLENDVSRAKALVPLVVNELRDLRSDYGDWCREHEERVGECIEAVGTALSAVSSSLDDGGVVERVDRDCGTSDWPEELDASVSEMRRLCDSNRELSEDLCKYRELCDKQASEISSMQVALREAVEQASSARDELEAYRQEKVSALSELERRLAVSSEECCALQAEVQRLEKSIEENCKTAVAIASRDWELHIEQVTSERDTALRELVELRGRLEAAESVRIGGVEEAGAGAGAVAVAVAGEEVVTRVMTSDVRTEKVIECVIEHDVALSSGLTTREWRETVSVGVGHDVEDDELIGGRVVDGWSDYKLEWSDTGDEDKSPASVPSSVVFVDAGTQVVVSELSLISGDESLSKSESAGVGAGAGVEMEAAAAEEEESRKSMDELRAELAFCYDQIATLSRCVEESGDSLRDVRHLLSVKEREVAELEEEKRRLSVEVSEGHETLCAERRDLEMLRANVAALEKEMEVMTRRRDIESGVSDGVVVVGEEVCVQTEVEDVFDLVSKLQLEVSRLRSEQLTMSTALELSQCELDRKRDEVQKLESRVAAVEASRSIPCEGLTRTPDVTVDELTRVDYRVEVEAAVLSGLPDRALVETVVCDTAGDIVPDRLQPQTTDSSVVGVADEELISPVRVIQSETRPVSEDAELDVLSTDSLRERLRDAMNRISELENAKAELSVRVCELEGVVVCDDKSTSVGESLSKEVEEAVALSKHNEDLKREVDLLRNSVSERTMLLDDVCMEMNEIRGSLGSLLSQVRDLRAAHTEANADRADMANKLIEYERAAVCLDSAADHPTREVQDADEPSKPSLSEYNALDELCRDLQRALDTRSSELETVVEKMRGCESVNAALTRECELLKHRVEKYTRVTTDLENDVSRAKALVPLVVNELRDLRTDYGDWCREHEERVGECIEAVGTALSAVSSSLDDGGVVERVDRDCGTSDWPEELDASVSEMRRLCDSNRELSEDLCKYRELCDKQASEISSMQVALREAVEQASSARDELEAYRQEKVSALSELERRLAVSSEECCALQAEVQRLEKSIEENCKTAVAIASRDWELHIEQVTSERDTALRELVELRGRLEAAESVRIGGVEEAGAGAGAVAVAVAGEEVVTRVMTSDVRTEKVIECVIEHDVALSSGLTTREWRETVSVGVGHDVEDDELIGGRVVDGWSDYKLEWSGTGDEDKSPASVPSSVVFVDAGTQVVVSELSLISGDESLSKSESAGVGAGAGVEMEAAAAEEEESRKSMDELRAELAFCYDQIATLSRCVEESGDSLRDVRHLLSVKEREVAELEEEKRRLSVEVSEGHETLCAERRDLEMLRANVAALEKEMEVMTRRRDIESGVSDGVVVVGEEVCVQTEVEDVFDLVSKLQLEVSRLRSEQLTMSTALELSQCELDRKRDEVQKLESRVAAVEASRSIPCEGLTRTPDVTVDELTRVDYRVEVEAAVLSGLPDRALVETVVCDTAGDIVPDRLQPQTTDSSVVGVADEELISPVRVIQSETRPVSEDAELDVLSTDSLRERLRDAMNRISELENAKAELSVRVCELEGVVVCDDKSTSVGESLSKEVEEAVALSKHNEDLKREVDLLRNSVSERTMLLDDVCMEMNEIRGSLGSLLSQVRDLRAAHTEANADRADMANKLIEYERAAVCLDSAADHPTREVQDADEPSKPSLSEYNALDELCRDLQRALDTRSSELETVVEKMRGCESVNAALTRECELLKHRVEKYTRVTTDLENDVSRAKALVPLVVNELRDLRTDYGDWCREHEERVGECIEAVGTALSAVSSSLDDGGVVERVDRDCGTSDWPEELDASVSEMRRLCDSNRELSEDLCKYRELCDKQASEISSMQVALREAVEQASSARDELEAYRQEKVSALSELERRLAVSSEECCALQAEVQRLEKSIEENCKTAVAIASRDWELHIEQVTSERDTALRELVELRGRLEAAESVRIGGVEEAGAGAGAVAVAVAGEEVVTRVMTSDVRTEKVIECVIEHDVALSSGLTTREWRETVSVGVGHDVEDDELIGGRVVDGWSDYKLEWSGTGDEDKSPASVPSSVVFVDAGTQVVVSELSLISGDESLSKSESAGVGAGAGVEMEAAAAEEEESRKSMDELRAELAFCYDQIATLSRCVEESGDSLRDVRHLLSVKEREVAELEEEKRRLSVEVSEGHETLCAERRDLEMLRANVAALEKEMEVMTRRRDIESGVSDGVVVVGEEVCVQTEVEDVFDLVSKLQLEVSRLRSEQLTMSTALELSQCELDRKRDEVQKLESRVAAVEASRSIPCEGLTRTPDVTVDELTRVDYRVEVEAAVLSGLPDRALVETVVCDTAGDIVPDRLQPQTTDSSVVGVADEELISPVRVIQSETRPVSEDAELDVLSTDSLRERLRDAMNRISELENAKAELSVRVCELEGVVVCDDKSTSVGESLSKEVEEAVALSKHNEDLKREVDLLRNSVSERTMLLDDVCMEMNEIRGSLGSLLSQVRDLRAAHTEANADRADMANKLIEYERAAVCLDSAADHPTREVQDADEPSKPSLSEYNALDELCRDLQRALDTRSSELETVVEKMRGCESVNAALTRECELLKHRVEKYTRVTTDLENDVSRAKALVPLVVNELRDLRTDYGDWCREHEERVGECIEAVGTALSAVSSSLDDGGVVERVDRDCGTSDWPEELDASVSEMRRLCDSNRELSEDLCKYRELCDKQASEISSMQVALREAVEQASSARDELEAYRQEKVSALSELERRLAVSSEECCALQAEVQRLEKSIEENCKTAVAIASRDWELHIEQVTSERDTALRELVELRGRLEAAESVRIGGVEEAGAVALSGHFASSSFHSPLSLVQSREPVQSFTSGLDSELSHLRREFSKTSMSLMYAVDLVDDCFKLLVLFIRLLTEILNTSSSSILDAEMSSNVINNLKNILSITNSTYFVEYFGDHAQILSEFRSLCDLIASNQQSSTCSICHRIIVPNDSIILSSLCMNCSTDLEGLDYARFREFIDSSQTNRYSNVASTDHPTTNGTNDEIVETARHSSTCLSVPINNENEICDTPDANTITTIRAELIQTIQDLEDKLLIAESERNRLNQLIYSLSMPTSTTSCSSSTEDSDEYKQLQLDFSNINNTNKHLKLFIHELFEEIYKYTKVSIEKSSSTSSLIESLQKLICLNHQVNDYIDLEDISRRFETIIEQLKQLKDTNKEDDGDVDILEMQNRLEQMQLDYEKLCFENIYLTKKINTQLSIDNQDKLDIGRGILNCTIEQLKQLNVLINKSIIDKSCYPLDNIDDTFKILDDIRMSENLMMKLNTGEYRSEIIQCCQYVKQLIEENLKLKTLQDLKLSTPSDVDDGDNADGDTPPAYQLDANLHEQFSTLETSLSTTMNCLLNRVDELTQRIDVLQSGIEKSSRHVRSSEANRLEEFQQDINNQILNDQLTSLKQRDIEWEVNINTLYNCLSQVIVDDEDKGRRQKDDEEVENEDNKSTKQPIYHPEEILPQFNRFINTAQTQINRIASLENQYNELNIQLNQLSEEYEQARCEVKRLQTTASQQTNDADRYTNMLDYLVAKIIDLSSELPDPSSSPGDDQDHELDVMRIPKSSSSTDIELILIRIKKYLCEYKSIQEKLRQVEEEKASLINRLAKQFDQQPEEVVEQEEVHTTLPVFSLEKPVEKIETVDTECLQMMSYAMPPPSAPPSSHKDTKPVIDQLSTMKDDIMLLRCETINMIETMNQTLESTIEYSTSCLIDTSPSSSSLLKKSEILFNFTKDLTTTVSLEPSIDDPLVEHPLELISEDDLTAFLNDLLNRINDTLKERNQPPSPSPRSPPPTTLDGDIHIIDSKLMHNYALLINKLSSILHLPTTSYRSDQFINAQIEEILNRLPNLSTNQKMNELCEYIDQLLIDLTDMMIMMMNNVVIEESDRYSIKVDELSEYLITNSLESTNLPERFIQLYKLLLHHQLSRQRQTPLSKTLVDVYSTGGGGVGRGQVETTEEVSRIESVSILRNIIKSCIIHEKDYRLLQSQLSQDSAVSSLTTTDTLDNDLLTLSFNELIDLLTQKWLQLDNRLKEFIDYIKLYHLKEREVITEQIDNKPQQQSVQRTTEHQLPFRRYRSNSFSYSPRLSCCNNNHKLVSIRNKNKSMLTLSTSSTTSSATTTLLQYTSLLELLTVLEFYTPAFLMHVKPMKEMHLTYHLKANTMKCGLQQLRRHLMQLTPPTHEQEQQQQQTTTRYTEELNTYLQHINTYLHVKELCTKQALNDLRSELISLNRQKHKLLKRKVSNVTTATTTSTKAFSLLPIPSTSSTVSIISTSSNILPTVIYEDEEVLQEKLMCTKDRLKQTILIYKCIQELLNYQSDYYYYHHHYNLKSIHNAQEVTDDHDGDRGRRLSGRGSTLCRSQLSNYANADDYWQETDIDAEYTHDRNRDLDQSQTTLLCNYDPDDGNLLYIGSSSSGNNDPEHRDQYNELEYALRLLHIRDTELLYLISLQHDSNTNNNTDTGYNNLKFNLSTTTAAYTTTTNKDISSRGTSSSSQWLKEKLDKFMHWNNVQPINMHSIPIHRIEFNQPQHLQQLQLQPQQQQIIDMTTTTPNLLVKSHLLSSTDDERSTALFTSQSFDHMTYYYEEETDIYEQHLYTLVQIALNKLDQLNKSYAEPKRPLLLSPDREDELTELLDRVIKLIPLESHISSSHMNKTTDSESIYSQLGRRLTTTAAAAAATATTTTTIMMTTTPAAITAIMTATTTTLSTGPSSTSSYSHYYKPVSSTTCESSDLSLMTNMTYPYPKRAEKAPIHDLVDSVDHLRNLHELRSLAKYLLDQYHIVTTELELQSDTNWCLRQRLSNANSQLDRLTDLLNKSSRTFQSIDERLTAEIHKHSTLTEQCDIARQDTRRVVHTLSEINQRHKPTSSRRLNFVPDSSEYLIKSSGASSSIQTMESKSAYKLKSKSQISQTTTTSTSIQSRISDPDFFVLNRVYVPFRMMQSISSQTEKRCRLSCLPYSASSRLTCGPKLKRPTSRSSSSNKLTNDRSDSRKRHQSASASTPTVVIPISSSTTYRRPSNTRSQERGGEARGGGGVVDVQSEGGNTQQTNNNNYTNWSEFESGQRKLQSVSLSIEKDLLRYYHHQEESASHLGAPCSSSTMITEEHEEEDEDEEAEKSKEHPCETHPLLEEYYRNQEQHHQQQQSTITSLSLSSPATALMKSENSTSSQSTSSSLSFTSLESHSRRSAVPGGNNESQASGSRGDRQLPLRQKKTKFPSRFMNLFNKSNYKKS
ncbi:unnamed protein product [Trichobilharzia szidati]|nr:unnamed protein product [Trichobilharzia szidati]